MKYRKFWPKNDIVGRNVSIVSYSFADNSRTLQQVTNDIRIEAEKGSLDLMVLPEVFLGNQCTQTVDGPVIREICQLAKQYSTYIISPLDIIDEEGIRRNTAYLIDRNGKVIGRYDKAFDLYCLPNVYTDISVPGVETIDQAPRPGEYATVFETDFGNIGIAMCFDVNFPELWQCLADADAELVIWPSAYSGGRSLQAHAINHHYYILSATGYSKHCQVYDITGERILSECDEEINISRISLDLDRGIYHNNWNLGPQKLDKLMADHGSEITIEQHLEDEEWFVLTAIKPGISARNLAKKYGLEELRDYIRRARKLNKEFRGNKDITTLLNEAIIYNF